jgi:hypothetical protein
MLSPIVTFREDGTAHIELSGGHLIAHHFYDHTDMVATVVEVVSTPDGFTEQQHRVVGVWAGVGMVFSDWTVAYALAADNTNRLQEKSINAAIRAFDRHAQRRLHQPARLLTLIELLATTGRARHLMDTGALSPTPHNLMAHTTKDTA